MSDDELIAAAIVRRADIEATPRHPMKHKTPEPGHDRWQVVCPNHGRALNWPDEEPMSKASPFKVVVLTMQTWGCGSDRYFDRHVWVGQCKDCGTIHAACD